MNPIVGNISDVKTKLVDLIQQHGSEFTGNVKNELISLIQNFNGTDVQGLVDTLTTKLNSYTPKQLPTPVKETILSILTTGFGG